MIVQCTSCRARFRVADEKVPARGVKMRCTKCATVFKVTPADALDATPRPSPDAVALPAPHASPGNAPAPGKSPAPGSDGIAPRLPQSYSLTYGAASPFAGEEGPDHEQRPGPPVAPPPPPPTARPAPSASTTPSTSASTTLDAALDAAMSSGSLPMDPFAELAPTPRPTQTPRPAQPARPTTPAPAYAPVDPFADSDPSQPRVPTSPQELTGNYGLPPPPLPQRRPAGMPPPSGFPPAGFPSSGSPPPPPMPPPANYGAGREVTGPPPQHAASPASSRERSQPFGQREHTAPPGLEPAPGSTGPHPTPARWGAGGTPVSTPMGRAAAMPEVSDPFANVDPAAGVMAATPRPVRERTQPPPRESTATPDWERSPSPSAFSAGLGRVRSGAQAASEAPPPESPRAARFRKFRRDVAAALVNVGSAAVVAFAALATVASIRSPTPLGFDDLGFPMVWMALGFDDGTDADSLLVRDVRTGTWRNSAGHELFYVRGEVENASVAGRAALYVMAEVVRGGTVLGTAESLARLDAGPEHLQALVSRKNGDLQQRLLDGAKSLYVKSKSRAPFIAVFPLSSRDVVGANVRLSVMEGLPADLRPAAAPLVAKSPPAEEADEAGGAEGATAGASLEAAADASAKGDSDSLSGDAVAGKPDTP